MITIEIERKAHGTKNFHRVITGVFFPEVLNWLRKRAKCICVHLWICVSLLVCRNRLPATHDQFNRDDFHQFVWIFSLHVGAWSQRRQNGRLERRIKMLIFVIYDFCLLLSPFFCVQITRSREQIQLLRVKQAIQLWQKSDSVSFNSWGNLMDVWRIEKFDFSAFPR